MSATRGNEMAFDTARLAWTRKPRECSIEPDRIEIVTEPHTDLWQRTYYRFRNDSAPVLQMATAERFFSFVVRCDFSSLSARGNATSRNRRSRE